MTQWHIGMSEYGFIPRRSAEVNEQRPNQQWIVKVNGVEEVRLDPGESLEIGRKPLRPLIDNGRRRLDVPDQTKSMSKRHALFSVSDAGAGTLRDLNSTNGTYVVRDDGELMRVSPESDFLLPHTTMRFQFGDVPVDFVRVELSVAADDAAQPVADLFSYAARRGVQQEPDAADMSVDDILDLRAGEPTSVFNASSVRSRVGALHAQVLADAGNTDDKASDDADAHDPERDLFADAIDEIAQEQPVQGEQSVQGVQGEQLGSAEQAARDETDEASGDANTAPSVGTQPPVNQPTAFRPMAQPAAPMQTQTPVAARFEPGSVFERVSRGEFASARPVVEAGGHTSDQAKNTRDFALQFDMARYPQLLPFLAMNPALYDDLYAWLEVQGNADIDAALKNNEGYRDYLAATGK